ncbi:NAD(P)/FAD-dependent oxidoreductase [Nocardia sp. CA2R105]|uniref:flavin-containing monooxygenase n=1 Tax=Nocardia coffeae TaxID=2873381 RepID=UPI001CA62103|nr:NAD(P)/FAD-dependent oxidoreductase [Nocardia coffeae]MBY8856823.1 NAD(P)/FAD-dependent oxidoreductase [Nocardia coffeae]
MTESTPTDVDVVVIGAGFGGLYALHALREKGFSVQAFEAGTDVGGTWFWNRYPGARCDVESLAYQYSFSQELVDEWTWTERYATQPEILAYANWVADRLDLRRDILFDTRVDSATYDEDGSLWEVRASDGSRRTARFVVAAAGSLSAVAAAPFPGVAEFSGAAYHPGQWPAQGVDFRGKRVAVIGVGSSGAQLIPEMAKQAAELVVFQRTPAYTLPARNRPLYEDEIISARRNHAELAESARRSYAGVNLPITGDTILDTPEPKRTVMLEKNWKLGGNLFITAFTDVGSNLEANDIVADFVRGKIRDIVADPEVAEKLTPTDYPIGAKRIITDTNFYATFNLPHVELVSVLDEPIERIVPEGVQTSAKTYPVDIIVYATGYDSLTGSLTRIDFRGRDGVSLANSWADGARTYLGLATAGFPNLFTITGPQSPSVLVNMFAAIEQHVEWIVGCLDYLRGHDLVTIEPRPEAQQWWADQVESAVQQTLYLHAKSWYRGTNIEGKATQFLVYANGLNDYRMTCDEIAAAGYRGFALNGPGASAPTGATTKEVSA